MEKASPPDNPTADGWHALPSGGKMLVTDGIPTQLSDGGNPYLDERVLLAESAALANMRLQLVSDRARRWRRRHRMSIFRSGTFPLEAVAKILRSPCEHCGEDAGIVWWPVPDAAPGWVCKQCHDALLHGAPWDE